MLLSLPGRRGRRTTSVLGGVLLPLALLAGCGEEGSTGAEDPASQEPRRTVPVEVFFVGDTPRGPRLFAERHAVDADDPLNAAAALLTSGSARDPDYRTLLPEDSFGTIAHDGDSFVVPVPDDGWRQPGGRSREEARLAVQQVVHTLQAAQGVRDPVVVTLGDTEVTTLFGADVEGGVTAADELAVRALVDVASPDERETVSGSFTAEGVASSFESTVPWEVRDVDGNVVLDGFSTAEGWVDRLYPWAAEVDVSSLEPGEYTFAAMTHDPSEGEGGGPVEDTKTIVIE